MIRSPLKLRRADDGAAITEFAMVAPVMMLMLLGFFDIGHSIYVRSVLQGAVQKAGRDSTIEGSNSSVIDQVVEGQVKPVAGEYADFDSQRFSYTDYSQVGQPEDYVDANANDQFDTGECFEDMNGNGTWDEDMGAAGQGGASDVVMYRMTVSYPRMFPMAGLLGWSEDINVSATTILRNQPYGEQVTPSVTECT
jgi:Flp pilus assembly protein TadG